MINDKRKITAEQIDRLYAFTRKHFVEHYDLQTELVDHLANAIEAKWQQQPELDFEAALQQEFKKFGIFGFMDVVEQRQGALTKKYYKLIWGYFRQFFKLPKIMLTLTGIGITYRLLLFAPVLYQCILLLVFIFSIIKMILKYRQYKTKVKQTGKKWLMEDLIFRCGGSGLYLYLSAQLIHFNPAETHSALVYLIASAILVLLIIVDYIVLFVIPARAEEHLKATYPEYGLEITK